MTKTVTIFHNPRCSTSRKTLELLEERGIKPDVVLYMDTPPDSKQIHHLLKQLNFSSARQLIRTKEDLYKELNLADASEQALIEAMTANPKLIERPIVVTGEQARLGRPPENVLEII
ncbi:arsenate reductase (glutaredoxin) [Budviciaceae bacterium CWB-B4]|uniref:Arsenate reductase n=1 Tax=Limnobaculum xujianqingii TaxID=2738837 RepID=A0A9D7FVT4_9GAMM|nr:arsenate reductase (glutaredoxin) [Limnobaculum xujianqingii]MBK5074477.1 arsenate reductase (glutaredoxin) [Limnobaculum xujianqingii]MBK5177857.1 arsenate reductase (glutaredoxin) [Limnobaculum xujianqingii]